MLEIRLHNTEDKYDYNELIKVFMPPDNYRLTTDAERCEEEADLHDEFDEHTIFIDINEENSCDKNHIKRQIYEKMRDLTGKCPPWGILTGVRPVKLTGELFKKLKSREKAREFLKTAYLLSEEKADVLMEIYQYQQQILKRAKDDSVGLYIGIPFCPTRCLYCSFTSNQKGPEEIEAYLTALFKEIEYCGQAMKDGNIFVESVYIGGGTPTTLTAEQLDLLLKKIEKCFDLSKTAEFTVEAGRPDTITKEKLDVLSAHKIQRISINPQTMKDETLKIIGRDHDSQQIRDAFKMAVAGYDFLVNADVIAGLPGEKPEDFERTLSELIELGPANITVHTLAVKKASRLIEADETYHYRQADVVEEMLAISKDMLRKSGYRPYYLYRQKHMAGALENIGYCKDDTPCVYNIRIMDESQSILALGAGGISKKYYPHENRLERVPNVSNYQIYIERIDEMIDRKRKNFFEEG